LESVSNAFLHNTALFTHAERCQAVQDSERLFPDNSVDGFPCGGGYLNRVAGMRDHPVIVYATAATIELLKQHIFNWKIWPDFSVIPSVDKPLMRYQAIVLAETVVLQGRKITALPAVHTVPAVGYHLDSGQASLVFSGDTYINDRLWEVLNTIENLRYLIIETAFPNSEIELARLSKHLCPSLLVDELCKFTGNAEVFVTHFKPDEVELIMAEVANCASRLPAKILLNNQEIIF